MKSEAEQFAEADKKRAEEIEIKNKGDTLVYSGRKFLKDYGDKIKSEDKSALESDLNELEQAVKEGNIEKIKNSTDKVNNTMSRIGQEMYKGGTTSQGPQGPTPEDKGNGTVEGEGTPKQ
jgi:molecular chaperone DnaK